MKVLLDTSVLIDLYLNGKQSPAYAMVESLPADALFVSVISLGKIINRLSTLKNPERKANLDSWVQNIESRYQQHILPVDQNIVRFWGEMSAKTQAQGQALSMADGLVAATAHAHGLYVMTRNTDAFEAAGVFLINPWDAAS